MRIGFIGFGEVAYTLSKKLLQNNVEVITSTKGRSKKTKQLAIDSGVKILPSYEELAKQSDILISATSPKTALAIAKKYGILCNGVFIDLNNISPENTKKIANFLSENNFNPNSSFVDGIIIGKISSTKSTIIVSGKSSDKIAILNNYGLNVKVISHDIGDASTIKMLRSIYTKGVTAIAYETFQAAEQIGLSNELFEAIAITESENFQFQTKSRLNSLASSKSRKFQEMDEVLDFLNSVYDEDKLEFNSCMSKATKNKFKSLKNSDF
ncbi:MAG: NAD(P)-binding domain-containing protein [Methanobrevibacter sp.]|nr:NAD(P)-binding domain-containing protein [Methanobrevibacter sp.]